MTTPTRKPRIALMGEFSAGKSTLSNLLLGARPLPERVTATRLSPVWMSEGTQAPYRVDVDGTEEPVSVDQLEGIPVEETRVIRLFFEADILNVCDLIDFPGISDPNMSSDVWQRMVPEVDAVLWCTHATQAWRQSEAAAWDTIPEAVREHSLLLVTRFDKLTTERDKKRVLARLGKETSGLFNATFPISLTEALAAGEDYDAFHASGGAAFLEHFLPLIETLHARIANGANAPFGAAAEVVADAEQATDADAAPESAAVSSETGPVEAAPENSADADAQPDSLEELAPNDAAPSTPAVLPRRVRPSGNSMRPKRPSRPLPSGLSADPISDEPPAPARPQAGASDLRSIFHGSDGKEAG